MPAQRRSPRNLLRGKAREEVLLRWRLAHQAIRQKPGLIQAAKAAAAAGHRKLRHANTRPRTSNTQTVAAAIAGNAGTAKRAEESKLDRAICRRQTQRQSQRPEAS